MYENSILIIYELLYCVIDILKIIVKIDVIW